MSGSNRINTFEKAKSSIKEGTQKVNLIKEEAVKSKPELQQQADELTMILDTALKAVEEFIPEDEKIGPTMRRFMRRILSREVIIAVVTIIAISVGNLDPEQAIGVAIAGTGLVLGRSVVKARPGTTEN